MTTYTIGKVRKGKNGELYRLFYLFAPDQEVLRRHRAAINRRGFDIYRSKNGTKTAPNGAKYDYWRIPSRPRLVELITEAYHHARTYNSRSCTGFGPELRAKLAAPKAKRRYRYKAAQLAAPRRLEPVDTYTAREIAGARLRAALDTGAYSVLAKQHREELKALVYTRPLKQGLNSLEKLRETYVIERKGKANAHKGIVYTTIKDLI